MLAIAGALAASGAVAADFAQRPAGQALLRSLAGEPGVDSGEARALLAQARYRPGVIDKMKNPAEHRLTWAEYRPIFVQPKRARQGAAYIRAHRAIFDRVERKYGVPAPIIAAIIGVETRYGRILGDDRIIDSLATLAFEYPPRAQFFTRELRAFIRLCVTDRLACSNRRGSYAGALGVPQFMPTSYQAYAVDGNRDGKRDLWDEPADVIASVANYLQRHGWRRDAPIAAPVRLAPDSRLGRGHDNERETTSTWQALRARGARVANPPPGTARVGLVKLHNRRGPAYWIGYKNLFVITDYNHSLLYALAVHDLARAIARRRTG